MPSPAPAHGITVAIRTDHPYLRRLVEIGRDRCDGITFVERGGIRQLAGLPRPAAFHLQWINVGMGTERLPVVLVRTAKLLTMLVVLRLRGVAVIWTCHNLSGKGHRRRRLDVQVRSIVSLLARRVAVLNPEATAAVVAELPAPIRVRIAGRTVHLPMPMLDLDHGPALDRASARRALGITPSQPLLVYLPGANQPDHLARFGSRGQGFQVLTVDRSADGGIQPSEHGWTFGGRPSDEEYGQLVCAADAVVLADERALASMTLHTAVAYRRPVISPACPAVAELADLGGAVTTVGPLGPGSVAVAVGELDRLPPGSLARAFEQFESRHADDVVARSLGDRYAVVDDGRRRAS